MARLNITTVFPDRTLERAIAKIRAVRQVDGALPAPGDDGRTRNVHAVVQGSRADERPLQLDLISHAHNGELRLGRWVISASETESGRMFEQLAPSTLAEIRLLGCLTGQTTPGRAAMRHLKQQLIKRFGEEGKSIKVYGTRNLTGARDFDENGFRDAHRVYLIEHDQLGLESAPDASPWFAGLDKVAPETWTVDRLRDEAEADARAEAERYAPLGQRWEVERSSARHGTIADVLASRDGDAWADPGLLQLPDFEILFPAPARHISSRGLRVTSLSGGTYLRVYPRDRPDGVLFRPRRSLAR